MTIRVLVADDQSMVRAGFRMLLSDEDGIEVVGEASNGLEAVDAVTRLQPNVVLMDIRMPELDGLEATRLIRESERGSQRHLPIVALTANAMKGDDLRCLSAGMDAYLPKPVTVAALKDLLIWFGSQE